MSSRYHHQLQQLQWSIHNHRQEHDVLFIQNSHLLTNVLSCRYFSIPNESWRNYLSFLATDRWVRFEILFKSRYNLDSLTWASWVPQFLLINDFHFSKIFFSKHVHVVHRKLQWRVHRIRITYQKMAWLRDILLLVIKKKWPWIVVSDSIQWCEPCGKNMSKVTENEAL